MGQLALGKQEEEDTRNKGEESADQGWEAADTTRRLAGHPCDNATAVSTPRGRSSTRLTHWVAFQASCLPVLATVCTPTGRRVLSMADDASRKKDEEQVLKYVREQPAW